MLEFGIGRWFLEMVVEDEGVVWYVGLDGVALRFVGLNLNLVLGLTAVLRMHWFRNTHDFSPFNVLQ